MQKFLNISNYILTEEQITDLKKRFNNIEIVELPEELKKQWCSLTPKNYKYIVQDICEFMEDENIYCAHLAGFMPAVAYMLRINEMYIDEGEMEFYYSFSERVSEEKEIDGKIVKTSSFKHRGWHEY